MPYLLLIASFFLQSCLLVKPHHAAMSVMDLFLATIKVILMGLMFVSFSTMNFALVTSKKEVVEGDIS